MAQNLQWLETSKLPTAEEIADPAPLGSAAGAADPACPAAPKQPGLPLSVPEVVGMEMPPDAAFHWFDETEPTKRNPAIRI